MKIGKLWMTALLAVMPATALAQVNVGVGVSVSDNYDTVAPGDPVESVDVFYDQLAPYGVWVDEPDVGRVFVPETADYVPYNNGHWQYTNLGFVWVSSEPHAWATAHYGRWAYSNSYARWYWLPDTEWGPAWVEWRQTGNEFGWAPLPPTVVVRAGWQPPAESWHYCGAAHVLDVDVRRYYEPRSRVAVIHREARPIEHYTTVSNVRVVVGPPAATLREHRVTARPVRVEARAVGRWSAEEARAQATRAREHQATFEVQNQHRIESNTRLHAAQVKVIDTHPQVKAQVTARVQQGTRSPVARPEPARAEPNRAEVKRPEPNRGEPNRPEVKRPEPNRGEPNRPEVKRPEPSRAEPTRPEPAPNRGEANRPEVKRPEPAPNRGEANRPEVKRPEPSRAEPTRPAPTRPEAKPTEPTRIAPSQSAPLRPAPTRPEPSRVAPSREVERPAPPRAEPSRPAPEPPRAEPARPAQGRPEPTRAAPAREPARPAPEHAKQPEPPRDERH